MILQDNQLSQYSYINVCMVGPVLNVWFNNSVLCFFAYIANSMIAHVDPAVYGVLLLDLSIIDCLEKLAFRI